MFRSLIGPSDKGPKHVVLLSNKDNKDTYFVVFDGFISILYLLHNGMENAKTTEGKRKLGRPSLTEESIK